MPLVPMLIQKRRLRRQQESHSPKLHAGLGFGLLVSLVTAILALVALFLYITIVKDLPAIEALPALLDPETGLQRQPSKLYDRTGSHLILIMENPAARDHRYIPLEDIPDYLTQATLASVDPSFWEGSGAALAGLGDGRHPTLAQRLVFEQIMQYEPPGLQRNLRERLLAAQVTSYYGHEKILEWYLNSTEYGHWIYGADAAARVYFGKSIMNIDLAEAALIAAAAQAPDISPLEATSLVIERQRAVIQTMLAQGRITADDAIQALSEELDLRPVVPQATIAPAFTNLALEQLGAFFPIERVSRGGWSIITTLDFELQEQTNCAVVEQIRRLESQLASSPSDLTENCAAARLLPTLALSSQSFTGLEAAAIILDPGRGQILAMTGKDTPGLNPAAAPGRPAGTALTPFVYLTAFTRGLSPASLYWDIPSLAQEITISNNVTYHGPVRLRTAFNNDYLGPARQLIQQIGIDNIIHTARQMGMVTLAEQSAANGFQSSILEEGETTLLELTQAYGIFANQGIQAGQTLPATEPEESKFISAALIRVETIDHQIFLDWSNPDARSVLSPQLAYLMNHLLSDEVSRWPSLGHPNLLEIGRSAGAKMGSSMAGQDTWTVGYTPQIVISAWMAQTEQTPAVPLPPETAATIWRALIQYTNQNKAAEEFVAPAKVNFVEVCDPSGLLATIHCPTIVTEVFLSGSEPTQLDNLYRIFQVNRETGRLATVFTPPELIDERVYLVVPPEAAEWAEKAGLPMPPDSYDVIYAPPNPSPHANISSPAMFAHVSGKLRFTGSANSANFSFYRLQVGRGLNPQEWLQIGKDIHTPVTNGLLGIWDTQELNGLYAVQLLVVRADQRVENSIIQVSIDNQPPEVMILNPGDRQSYEFDRDKVVVLQASASDDLELASVIFSIGGQPIASLTQAPFNISWPMKLGVHTLLVTAVDLAGNQSAASITFTVK